MNLKKPKVVRGVQLLQFAGMLGAVLSASCSTPGTARVPGNERSPASAQNPAVDGQWSAMVQFQDRTFLYPGTHERPRPQEGWWVTGIHAHLLGDGNVLLSGWSRAKAQFCEDHLGRQNGTSFVLSVRDIENATPGAVLAIQPIAEAPRVEGDVLYCAGGVPLPDGRIFLDGGARYKNLDIGSQQQEYGLNYSRIFDPRSRTFKAVERNSAAGPHPTPAELSTNWSWYEQGMKWYPTATRIPGGKVLVTGGLARQTGPFDAPFENRSLSVFDPAAYDLGQDPWSVLVESESSSPAVELAAFDYPHTVTLPKPLPAAQAGGFDRQVAVMGGLNGQIAFLSLDPGVPQDQRLFVPAQARRPSGDGALAKAVDTTMSLTSTGEILIMGGGDRGTHEGSRIDLYDPYSARWRSVDTGITRLRAASTLLPDGTVLLLNGEAMWRDNDTIGDRRRPTLFDPQSGLATNLAPWSDDSEDRGYHNFSLLLKDGRVLVGGGRTLKRNSAGVEQFRIGCERTDVRIFSPPYLFRGPRPSIQGASEPMALRAGGPAFELRFAGPAPRAIGGVVLMAMGSETHHFDQNQRIVKLPFRVSGPGILQITPPQNTLAAPEGEYNLFLVSDAGVPSSGVLVRVGAASRLARASRRP